jgi:hypothetical protein
MEMEKDGRQKKFTTENSFQLLIETTQLKTENYSLW